eukprot:gene5967-6571_t
MFRDQRIHDNHAFHYAQLTAKAYNIPLYVIFNVIPGGFLGATLRQYDFMLRGLEEVERELHLLEIPFYLLIGDPIITIPDFVLKHKAMMIVNDFFPLRQHMEWSQTIATRLSPAAIPMIQVDAHNIVPCWVASPKLEYSARTFRSKITPKLAEYLTEIPPPQANPPGSLLKQQCEKIDWKNVLATLPGINREVLPITWLQPGRQGGEEIFQRFVNERLHNYGNGRNDPNNTLLSDLSPYLHFGQLSMQSLLLRLKAMKKQGSSVDSFVEEAVVRRELTDNFCFYNPHYDSLEGCYEWARETLNAHRHDPRPFLYSGQEFEEGRTHDDLWNAAQIQMTREGKMHGFLRMYWAKKILEWSASPEEALSTAIYLNDKYELDGRDPSGYVGCMWSIGGIHDQGWAERAIFGKIRYMNYQGCERKFDVKKFVQRYPPAAANALALTKQSTLSFSSSANVDIFPLILIYALLSLPMHCSISHDALQKKLINIGHSFGGPIHVRITDFNTSTTLVPEEASGGICCGCFSRASHAPPPPATPPDEDFHCEDLLRLSLGYTAYRVIEPSRPLTDPPPLVVCLHGLYTSSSCYADLSELLAEYEEGPHARVLLYDFYGRGRSPWTGLPLSLDMYVTQLKELLDALKFSTQEVSLIGYDLGGAVATGFAAKFPHLTLSLTLLSPVGIRYLSPFQERTLQQRYFGEYHLAKHKKDLPAYQLRDFYQSHNETSHYLLVKKEMDLVKWQIRSTPGYLGAILSTFRCFPLRHMDELYEAVGKHPRRVLVICGERDQICPYHRCLQVLEHAFPYGEIVDVVDCGHNVLIEKFDEITTEILAFQKEVSLAFLGGGGGGGSSASSSVVGGH